MGLVGFNFISETLGTSINDGSRDVDKKEAVLSFGTMTGGAMVLISPSMRVLRLCRQCKAQNSRLGVGSRERKRTKAKCPKARAKVWHMWAFYRRDWARLRGNTRRRQQRKGAQEMRDGRVVVLAPKLASLSGCIFRE